MRNNNIQTQISQSVKSDNISLMQQLLNNPVAADIINLDSKELLKFIDMTKKFKHEQELLKQHLEKYHIWENSKGVFLSYLPAPDKLNNRKPVTAKTKEKLERKIIDFYLDLERIEKENSEKAMLSTLRKIYPYWLQIKSLETTAGSYIRRIDNDWHKYYLDTPVIDEDIRDFTRARLREWALQIIREHSLTKNQYYNMAVIIRQCLDYAVEQGVISENLYNSFKIDGKLFRKVKKPEDSTQVFLTDERPLIEAEAWKDFEQTGCTVALAIPLAFQTFSTAPNFVKFFDGGIENCGFIRQNAGFKISA